MRAGLICVANSGILLFRRIEQGNSHQKNETGQNGELCQETVIDSAA
jgi:hypothetical protein